jgi:hypothetical protein
VPLVLVAALGLAMSSNARGQTLPDDVVTASPVTNKAPIESLVNAHKADLASAEKAQKARKALAEPFFRSARASTSFRLSYSNTLMPVAAPLVKDPSDEVAVNAIRLAGLVGTKEGIEAAESALTDKRETVRVAAAGAVAVSISTCKAEDHALLPSTANEAISKLDAAMKAEKSARGLDALVLALDSAMRIPNGSVASLHSSATDVLLANAERIAASKDFDGADFDPFFARTAKALSDAQRQSAEADRLSDSQKQKAAALAGAIVARAERRLEAGNLSDTQRQEVATLAEEAGLVANLMLGTNYRLGDLVRTSKDSEFKDNATALYRKLGK